MNQLPPKPKDALWTDEQWQAIMTRNTTTLVSAAAGSGKTAVLVERIIQRLLSEDDPVDVDRLLVVTFTNAAAAEMRKRIGDALEKALAKQPANLHLRRQLSLLNRASISTLHSFCIEVLRTHYYKLGIDPGFRILDDTEAALMREEIVEELFEEEYSDPNNETFFRLVDAYSNDRSDVPLQRIVEKLYDFSRSHPWPNEWLDFIVSQYNVANKDWIDRLLTSIKNELQNNLSLLEEAERLIELPGGPKPYSEAVKSDKQQLIRLIEAAEDWNSLYTAFQTIEFPKLKSVTKKDNVSEHLKDSAKDLRDHAKDNVNTLKTNYFSRPLQSYVDDMIQFAPIIQKLIELVKAFADKFSEAKREKAVCDFSDLEHFCLDILLEEGSTPDKLIPSDIALDYKEKFCEILVDEYQDTNHVQETIIQLVAKSDNMFMVGDVKQSIYRFRLAEPTLFLNKYKDFSKTGNQAGLRIDLAKNFRSREEVLDATNFIFRQLMDETVGELNYDSDAELKHGFEYPDNENCEAEFVLIEHHKSDDEDVPEELEEAMKEELEARFIANQIKQLIQTSALVYDTKLKRMRPVTYRDIVILMRSTSNSGNIVIEELKKHGIPTYIEMSSGYFEATEIQTMLSLLQVIDNPDQDIPLASVLRSPIVGLSEEELAKIRIANKQSSFFHAMATYMDTDKQDALSEKLQQFYENVKKWRTLARQGALSDLIWQLYRDTKYYDFVGGLPGGVQRQANLRALYDRARQYEQTSFRGLFRFLRFIERMQESGKDLGTARALGEQEDVVRIMTIHSSKGLEFPVVFIAGLSKQFNTKDLNGNVLIHKDYGIGTKFIDVEKRISYPTLLQLAMKEKLRQELLAEEMRILYVAMTRAREKLYLIGTVKNLEKDVQKWQTHLNNENWLLSEYSRRDSKSYLDWIGPALIRHRDSKSLRDFFEESEVRAASVYTDPSRWKISCIHARDLIPADAKREQIEKEHLKRIQFGLQVDVSDQDKERVFRQLDWTYPQLSLTQIKAKQTVTEIKRQREVIDEQSEQAYVKSFQHLGEERPRFLQKTKLTAAERGTAMHTFMQHVPFQHVTLETLEEKLHELIQKELLTEEQAEAIDLSLVYDFTNTTLFERIQKARNVYREIPFTYAMPASENSNEKVMIQGVIDLVLEEDDGLVLIDYKTDAITNRFDSFAEAVPILKQRYDVQLELYAKALRDIWKKNVKAKYLYFFDGSHILEV